MSKLEKETCRSSFARRQQETIYAPWRQQWIKLKRETTWKAKTQSLIIEENDLMPRLNVHPSTVVGRRRKTLSIAERGEEKRGNYVPPASFFNAMTFKIYNISLWFKASKCSWHFPSFIYTRMKKYYANIVIKGWKLFDSRQIKIKLLWNKKSVLERNERVNLFLMNQSASRS